MHVARFSYDISPADRQQAIEFIQRELEAARHRGLNARLLIPLTRGAEGAALQFEVELRSLDELEEFRHRGVGTDEETSDWMHNFSEILACPPAIEILRVEDGSRARSRSKGAARRRQ